MTDGPLISVLLPCYDAERTLPAALGSLLRQTYAQLEVVAIDDGSRDGTAGVLERHAEADPRVRVVRNPANQGLIRTLNRGVAEARGSFIARMDADDVAKPQRLERQLRYLAEHDDVGALGSAVELIDADGTRALGLRPARALGPGATRFMALFATPVAHPTLMARAEVMRAHPYGTAPQSLHTEDYELFTRMLEAGVQVANLPEPLVTMRLSETSVSRRHEEVQIANFVACAEAHLQRAHGVRPDPGAHRVLVNRMGPATTARDLRRGLQLLDVLERRCAGEEPDAAQEIAGIADEHRVDILVQALLKPGPGARLSVAPLALSAAGALLSPRGRRYLASKTSVLPRRVRALVGL